MKSFFFSFLIILTGFAAQAQAPEIEWQKSFGGTNADFATSIRPTTDNGYIVAGESHSNDGDVSGNHGISDCWIVKLNNAGDLQWQHSFGGTDYDGARSIQQTTDGGYTVAGVTRSDDGDITDNHGGQDSWILKLDSAGILQWQRTFGGTGNEQAVSIQQTADGGYIHSRLFRIYRR